MMLLKYSQLDTSELTSVTAVDVLVRVDADLEVLDDDRLIYYEPDFPVVELARALVQWIDQTERSDFAFDSMSFEEIGALTIRSVGEGWVFGSVFAEPTVSRAVSWAEVERCSSSFVAQVVSDLVARGIDPALVGLST